MDNKDLKKMHDEFNAVLKKIKEYDRIVCFRHKLPDYDAFGSQMGLATWIKENFPSKEVHYVGESNSTWVPSIYPEPEVLDDSWYAKGPFLAITTDTATVDRISANAIDKADFVIKIDHHPNVDPYGNMNVVYPKVVAASQLIALFALSRPRRYKLSAQAAKYLYSGIVGDSGRFLFNDVDCATLRISGDLLQTGFDMSDLYDKMYARDLSYMEALKFVLNNTKITEKGTAYYVLADEDLKRLGLNCGQGKMFVNEFRDVKGVLATVSCTEDKEAGVWRVSLRSNHKKIDGVASKYRGGGHDRASGATLENISELESLIADVDAVERDR